MVLAGISIALARFRVSRFWWTWMTSLTLHLLHIVIMDFQSVATVTVVDHRSYMSVSDIIISLVPHFVSRRLPLKTMALPQYLQLHP